MFGWYLKLLREGEESASEATRACRGAGRHVRYTHALPAQGKLQQLYLLSPGLF